MKKELIRKTQRIFAVSDIHGHVSILKSALAKSGFIMNSPGHLLVICGDCFDRGSQNRELYDWLKKYQTKSSSEAITKKC